MTAFDKLDEKEEVGISTTRGEGRICYFLRNNNWISIVFGGAIKREFELFISFWPCDVERPKNDHFLVPIKAPKFSITGSLLILLLYFTSISFTILFC